MVTALCFLPCFFVAPLAAMVPAYATAPVLVLVGAAMFGSVRAVDFGRLEDAVPDFLTIVLIPLTFSITQGILWGRNVVASNGPLHEPLRSLLAPLRAL